MTAVLVRLVPAKRRIRELPRLVPAKRRILLAVSASIAIGCSSEPADDAGATEDDIIGGVISGPQDNAVAVFGAPDGVGYCSGTLIAPNLVLTAKHCVRAKAAAPRYSCTSASTDVGALRPAAALTVLFGSDLSGTMESRTVTRIVDDGRLDLCDHDVAVLVLATPVTSVAPRALRTTALARGEKFTAVGWGMTENGIPDLRRKRSGVTVLPSTGSMGPNEILTTTAICKGDSGGPLFDASGRVVSVVSRIRNGCASGNGIHLLVRTAAVRTLVDRAKNGT